MNFIGAMQKACNVLGINKQRTNVIEIIMYGETRTGVGLCLYGINLSFFENEGECDFAVNNYIHGTDKLNIKDAIEKALELCELVTNKMVENEE